MEISVETFWIVYIVTLIILGVVLFVFSRAGKIKLSIAFFLAAVLAGIFTVSLIYYSLDMNSLSPGERQTLNLLFGTMGVIAILCLFWMLFDIIGPNSKTVRKVEVDCDEDGCTLTTHETSPGRYTKGTGEVDFHCDDSGCAASSMSGMTPRFPDETLNLRFIV